MHEMQVVRYPWYAVGLAGGSPAWLTWARYSAFLILYPIGVVSEMWLLYAGLPAARERKLHSFALPNAWNFAFDYSYFFVVRPSNDLGFPTSSLAISKELEGFNQPGKGSCSAALRCAYTISLNNCLSYVL